MTRKMLSLAAAAGMAACGAQAQVNLGTPFSDGGYFCEANAVSPIIVDGWNSRKSERS